MVAPAWGTTRREAPSHAPMSNFNPRTYAGCDITGTIFVWMIWDFNPCTRVGCDPMPPTSRWWTQYFNPRTRVGCDTGVSVYYPALSKFQSTHPRGVRQQIGTKTSVNLHFYYTPFHKTLSNQSPLSAAFPFSPAIRRYFLVRTSRQIPVHLGFAPKSLFLPALHPDAKERPCRHLFGKPLFSQL